MHFPDLEVCCDWSTFFPLKSADVSGAGTRDEPLRKSAWEATRISYHGTSSPDVSRKLNIQDAG